MKVTAKRNTPIIMTHEVGFDPTFIPNLVAWYDVPDASTINAGSPIHNDNVYSIVDKSGTSNLSQGSAPAQPQYKDNATGPDGLPYIFGGSGKYLDTLIASNPQITLFTVLIHSTGTSADFERLWGSRSSTSYHGSTGTALFAAGFTTPNVINGLHKINGSTIVTAGFIKPTSWKYYTQQNLSSASHTVDRIGQDRAISGRGWNGGWSEHIAYNRTLSTSEILQVEAYIKAKYNF